MYDVDKINMFFYNYDDDMKPILSEEQVDKERINELKKQAKIELKEKHNIDEPTKDDIDLYIQTNYGETALDAYEYNKLLEAEINIFINPVNYWQMRMPIVDDYLKKELLPFMNSKVDKWREQNPDLNYVDDKKSTYSQVLTPSLNITKTILYLQGKAGVGIFALQGTAHAISGYTFMPIENNYSGKVFNMNGDDSKSFVQEVKSSLPFDKSLYNNDISHNTSKDGKIVTETNSQLLSSQVDIGKSPYPAVMGIILENLGFLSYLMRRGVPMEIGLQLVQHPVVKKFTKYRASKESIYSKALKEDSGRNDIIKDYITDVLKHSDPELAQMIQNRMVYTVLDSTGQAKSLLSTSRIDERVNIKINKGKEFYELVDTTTEDRMNILMGFFQVLDQSVEYSKLIKHVKFDTQTFKDKTEFDSWKNNKTQLAEAGFFSNDTITDIEDNSLIAPFKKVKDKYGMFDNLYYENMTNQLVPRLIDMFKVYKTEDKQNMSKKLSADLIAYLVQNKMNQFLEENNLLRQKDGKAFEMTDVQTTINQFVEDINKYKQVKPNYFLDKMNIMLGFLNGTSAIFTRDRVRNTYEIDDMLNILQEIKEENPDIFTKIVLLPFLSTGLATGRFNYQDVLPQELRYKLIYRALVDSIGNITKEIEDDFLTKFIINNFNSIKTQNYHAKANISRVTRVRLYEGGQSQHYIRIPSNIKTPFKDNIIDLTDLEKSRVLLDYLSSIPRITSLPQAKTETGFQGYIGGFSNEGKGTVEGDFKDKAMRSVAKSAIVALNPSKGESSSLTSLKLLGEPKGRGETIMLAINGSYGKPLEQSIKNKILKAHIEGSEFIVGDMPSDSSKNRYGDDVFINYLQEIGAKFTIYHGGNSSRIKVGQKQLTENKLNPQYEKFNNLNTALLEFNKVKDIILDPVIEMTQVIKKNDDGTTTLLAVYDKNNQLITSDFLMKDDRRMTLNEIMEDLYTKICKI